jgi:hypothetical protein
MENGEVLDSTQVLLLRRFTMNVLIYKNLQRSGTIKNLTITEYRSRKDLGNHSVISVASHKTSSSFGSAKVVVESSLIPIIDKLLKLQYFNDFFVHRYLEYRPSGGDDKLFLTSNGLAIQNPHRELNQMFKSVGMEPTDMCPTEHRKRMATEMDNEEVEKSVCQMMDHSISTHRSNYVFNSTINQSISNYKKVNQSIVSLGHDQEAYLLFLHVVSTTTYYYSNINIH